MLTTEQLRIALSDRAAAAEPELDRAERAIRAELHRAQVSAHASARTSTGPRRGRAAVPGRRAVAPGGRAVAPGRRAVVTGWAAAAAVATLVLVPVALAQRSHPAPGTPSSLTSAVAPAPTAPSMTPTTAASPGLPTTLAAPAPALTPVTAVSHTAARPPTTAPPNTAPSTTAASTTAQPSTVRPTTGRPTTGRPTTAGSDGSARTDTFVNLIGVGIDRSIDWDLRADAEYVTVQMPGNQHASVTAFAPSVHFDVSRIEAAQPLTVAGTSGWSGNISVWPTNGLPDPVSGKQDGAVPSVAWQMGSTWVVVQSDAPSGMDPTQLAALAGSLGITDRPPVLRLPFTVGYLPADFSVQSYGFSQAKGTDDPLPPGWDVVLASAFASLQLSLSTANQTTAINQAPPQTVTAVPGFRLQVSGSGLTEKQLATVRSSTTTTADPAGPQDDWPTLAEALP